MAYVIALYCMPKWHRQSVRDSGDGDGGAADTGNECHGCVRWHVRRMPPTVMKYGQCHIVLPDQH